MPGSHASFAERSGGEPMEFFTTKQCSYRLSPRRACDQLSVYWLYARDCGCLVAGVTECSGHTACEQHAQLARAEDRVISIRLIGLTSGQTA